VLLVTASRVLDTTLIRFGDGEIGDESMSLSSIG
jgi:hypothetical protein